ncbi:MAG TPA: glycosyltransferase [Flexivirga sp.]|uniref:glycosyltransferase n=1 Tax=Flexivirga sp. TaxID=1962927 RepID=UPI002C6381C2|nr:glycosyltransferase [Flexivirga sp.]HWC22336.1 glycosyltransferase [Flexivirga sp.]
MRILFTFIGGTGHFEPMAPVVRAAEAAGHEVAVACSGGPAEQLRAAGFRTFATSPCAPPAPRTRTLTPLVPDDAYAAEMEFAENFADKGARRHAAAVQDPIRDWRPDLIVRDEADFGTAIAAEAQDVPVATILVLAAGLLIRPDLVAPPLAAIRAEHGLPPDPDLAMLSRGMTLSPFAPSFRSPHAPVPLSDATVHFRSAATKPTAKPQYSPRRRVYVTLGTVFNSASGDLFERLLAGLTDLDADVVVTVGPDLDPADFGPQPAHLRVERFLPQDDVLRKSDLVVSHGGSGSVSAALAHGLPSVLLPLGADQPHNAARAHELGLAVVLDAGTVTPETIRETVSETLRDAAIRERACDVADEMRALPDAAQMLPALEEYVAIAR